MIVNIILSSVGFYHFLFLVVDDLAVIKISKISLEFVSSKIGKEVPLEKIHPL